MLYRFKTDTPQLKYSNCIAFSQVTQSKIEQLMVVYQSILFKIIFLFWGTDCEPHFETLTSEFDRCYILSLIIVVKGLATVHCYLFFVNIKLSYCLDIYRYVCKLQAIKHLLSIQECNINLCFTSIV